MGALTGRRRREALWNWLRWTPVVVIPLSVLFTDAWLQTENWRRDFELGRLAEQRKAIEAVLSQHDVAAASLQDLDRLEYMATSLGLVEPDPTQIIAIKTQKSDTFSEAFAVARIQPADNPGAGVALSEAAQRLPDDELLAAPLLNDIPESTPVRGMGLVTLEAADDDLDEDLLRYTEDLTY